MSGPWALLLLGFTPERVQASARPARTIES